MKFDSFIIADIGNSRTKLLVESKYYAFDYSPNLITEIRRQLSGINLPEYCFYSSVNNYALTILQNEFKQIKFINIVDKLVNLEIPKGMGSDRLLGLLGAENKYDVPIITIDCGTALTINYMDENHKIKGGAIFAGAYTQLNALSRKTSMKNFDFQPTDEKVGANTQSALSIGIFSSIIGGIKELIPPADKINSIIITGGYGELIAEQLSKDFPKCYYEADLIMSGIKSIVEKL